jgi:GGDEF domain-containing protein
MVDELLGMFHSENDFIHDLEAFLTSYQADREEEKQQQAAVLLEENPKEEREVRVEPEEHAISLIGIDVDHLGSLAVKYGNQAVRNLCREIGLHIRGELDSTFKKYPGCQFYHIVADRFYVLLKYVPYDQVLKKAQLLKKSLDGSYRVSLFQSMGIQHVATDTLIELAITVRLAVSSYDGETLQDLLERYPGEHGVINVRETIERGITTQLKKGMADGGNVIRAWNPKARLYEQLAAEEA